MKLSIGQIWDCMDIIEFFSNTEQIWDCMVILEFFSNTSNSVARFIDIIIR